MSTLDPSKIPGTMGGQFKRHLPAYLLGTVVLAAFQLSMNRIDAFSKRAIDTIFGPTPESAWIPASFILGLAVVAFITRVASRYFIFNAGRDVEYEMRALLLHRLHQLGSAFYRKISAGEIMSRATNDLGQVRLLYGFGVLNVVNVLFAFASALQIMLSISWRLTLASFVMLPLLVVFTRSFSKQMFTRTRANQESLGKMSSIAQSNLAGVRVVRSFALEERELARFRAVNKEYLEASLGLARLRGAMIPMLGAASAVSVLVFFIYGASLLLEAPEAGGITKGGFFAFQAALARMTWPIIALGFSLSIVQRGRACFVRLQEIFEEKPEIVDGEKTVRTTDGGGLVVRGLSFAYGARKVLDGVDFTVPAGKSLAIVGKTGAGKSTLALLLARLLPTAPGQVLIDGVDICDMKLRDLRTILGYAQQDAFLFSTTVSRNIAFALDDPDAPEAIERVRDAAREAQVLEEAMSLPEGFDTVVGERGVQLSGGQRQRIALARALIWEPRILLLDDPLSAVDAKTEASILEAIERQTKKRTVILVTHRVAAASKCDAIVVLDQGKVVDHGTHAELVARPGIYRDFADEQRALRELEAIDETSGGDASAPGTSAEVGA